MNRFQSKLRALLEICQLILGAVLDSFGDGSTQLNSALTYLVSTVARQPYLLAKVTKFLDRLVPYHVYAESTNHRT